MGQCVEGFAQGPSLHAASASPLLTTQTTARATFQCRTQLAAVPKPEPEAHSAVEAKVSTAFLERATWYVLEALLMCIF